MGWYLMTALGCVAGVDGLAETPHDAPTNDQAYLKARPTISTTCEISSWPRTSGCLSRADRKGVSRF